MKIVGTDAADVEVGLVTGKLNCPDCGGTLRPWGSARSRIVRLRHREERRAPRRSRCRSCKATHVLVPNDVLVRRRDGVEVIGDALTAAATGNGFRTIARRLGRPPETVRGWIRHVRLHAERVRVHFTGWAVALDADAFEIPPTGSSFGDALGAIATAGRAAVLGGAATDPWRFASAVTVGRLLANTTSPWASP